MAYVVPTLRVEQLDRALDFYRDVLGFELDWEWRDAPELPPFAQVRRDGMMLYLSEGQGDSQRGNLVYLYVDDVDSWYRELLDHGATSEGPPFDQAWGNREFRVLDPDANVLCICAPLRRPKGHASGAANAEEH